MSEQIKLRAAVSELKAMADERSSYLSASSSGEIRDAFMDAIVRFAEIVEGEIVDGKAATRRAGFGLSVFE